MPRYLVERSFSDHASGAGMGEEDRRRLVETNARVGVTWLHSWVSPDGRRMYCLYEGQSPEAVRHAALLGRLPVDTILEVVSLDPFPFRPDQAETPTQTADRER